MKRSLLTLLIIFSAMNLMAQEKFDNVIFTNGVEYSGRVTSVAGDSISFVHRNESLPYRFAKSKIFRIEPAAGALNSSPPLNPITEKTRSSCL